jgi:hypothetical protein
VLIIERLFGLARAADKTAVSLAYVANETFAAEKEDLSIFIQKGSIARFQEQSILPFAERPAQLSDSETARQGRRVPDRLASVLLFHRRLRFRHESPRREMSPSHRAMQVRADPASPILRLRAYGLALSNGLLCADSRRRVARRMPCRPLPTSTA